MKFFGLQFCLLTLSSGAAAIAILPQDQAPPACAPVAQSCRALPASSAKVCSSLIKAQSRSYISCRRPQGTIVVSESAFPTVTSTRLIQATTTTTTVTSTTTIRGPTVTRPPVTLPATVTTTQVVTSISSLATTTTTTTTEISTSFTSTTTTQIAYDQSQVPWVQQSCSVVDKRGLMEVIHEYFKRQEYRDINGYEEFLEERKDIGRFVAGGGHDGAGLHRRVDPVFPADCSCFLTKTMLDVQPATTTTTIIKQITSTTTKILGGTVPTKTDTLTISKTTSLAGATIPARTLYSTSTSTILSTTWTSTTRISTSVTTWTTSTTSTSTSITTSTQTNTRTIAPCDPGQWGRRLIPGGQPSNARVVQGYARPAWPQNANNEQQCCSDCFVNPYCVFWAMPTDGTQCKYFIANDDNYECATEQCPRGYPVLDVFQADDGWVYHPGNCGNKWRAVATSV